MNLENLTTIESLEDFIDGNQAIAYSVPGDKTARYKLVQKILMKFHYLKRSKQEKGTITRFLIKLTGYSRQQLVRLISQYKNSGHIRYRPANNGFTAKYTDKDIRLLAKIDEQHESPCGHAIKKLCERAYNIFDETEYHNLAMISVSHIYNLRLSARYKNHRRVFDKTKSRQVAIGERRKPQSNGEPGYMSG